MEAAVILIFCFCIYFLPWIVAASRKSNNTLAVFMLNLFLGWTLIGWVVALVWACVNSKPQTIIIRSDK